MREIAIIIDGVWQLPVTDEHNAVSGGARQTPPVTTSTDNVERIAEYLAEVVLLAQSLTPQDARRAREFLHAASSVLAASTVLPLEDQRIFETHLRNARK